MSVARTACAALSALMLGCSSSSSSTTAPGTPNNPPGMSPVRVLMLTATAGFRHDSISTARQVMTTMGATTGEFTVVASDDVSAVDAASLANQDVLFFAMTSGELPLTPDQRAAILAFVSRGGGFVGTHSATDTSYDWAEYGALIGARFRDHPWTRQANVIVEDQAHPSTSLLGSQFSIEEEFYAFRDNPRPRVHVLLRLDASSVGAAGDYPLAWTLTYGGGRVYYNALGHFSSTWNDRRYQQQIAAAIRWAAGR
ncbi:MAG TPA: ThuA domain-containing protein [Vicinamibacterales bacterium]|jgi:type 1 glutamine amidotransferase